MRLALIHSPLAGHNRRKGHGARTLATQAGVPCWEASRPDEVEAVMPEIAEDAPDLLIVNGGDGLVDAVTGCLRQKQHFEAEPMVALLRGGTTNMIARDVGLHGSPRRALGRLLRAVGTGAPGQRTARAPFRVRGHSGADALFGYFLGGGAFPGVVRRMRHVLHPRGFVGRGSEAMALLHATGSLLFGDVRKDRMMEPGPLEWSLDGAAEEDGQVVLYFVTTLDRLVLGINSSRETPGLRFLALRHPYRNIAASVAAMVTRRPFDRLGENFTFRESQRLSLKFEGEAMLDGETLALVPGPAKLDLELAAPITFWRI